VDTTENVVMIRHTLTRGTTRHVNIRNTPWLSLHLEHLWLSPHGLP